jgi:hypothetical protein
VSRRSVSSWWIALPGQSTGQSGCKEKLRNAISNGRLTRIGRRRQYLHNCGRRDTRADDAVHGLSLLLRNAARGGSAPIGRVLRTDKRERRTCTAEMPRREWHRTVWLVATAIARVGSRRDCNGSVARFWKRCLSRKRRRQIRFRQPLAGRSRATYLARALLFPACFQPFVPP